MRKNNVLRETPMKLLFLSRRSVVFSYFCTIFTRPESHLNNDSNVFVNWFSYNIPPMNLAKFYSFIPYQVKTTVFVCPFLFFDVNSLQFIVGSVHGMTSRSFCLTGSTTISFPSCIRKAKNVRMINMPIVVNSNKSACLLDSIRSKSV